MFRIKSGSLLCLINESFSTKQVIFKKKEEIIDLILECPNSLYSISNQISSTLNREMKHNKFLPRFYDLYLSTNISVCCDGDNTTYKY
jgi:hypothetical protein